MLEALKSPKRLRKEGAAEARQQKAEQPKKTPTQKVTEVAGQAVGKAAAGTAKGGIKMGRRWPYLAGALLCLLFSGAVKQGWFFAVVTNFLFWLPMDRVEPQTWSKVLAVLAGVVAAAGLRAAHNRVRDSFLAGGMQSTDQFVVQLCLAWVANLVGLALLLGYGLPYLGVSSAGTQLAALVTGLLAAVVGVLALLNIPPDMRSSTTLRETRKIAGYFWMSPSKLEAMTGANQDGRVSATATAAPAKSATPTQGRAENLGPHAGKTREQLVAEVASRPGWKPVADQLDAFAEMVEFSAARKANGLPDIGGMSHLLLLGGPGTGKSTIAEYIAAILKSVGALETGHTVMVNNRGEIVGENIGSSGIKTNALCDQAKGGVFFMDEIYSYKFQDKQDMLGQEVVDALTGRLEADRGEYLAVGAGYPEQVEQWLKANPGLASRFSRRIHIPDYDPAALLEIWDFHLAERHLDQSAAARATVAAGLVEEFEARDPASWGNAREVRNLLDESVEKALDHRRAAGTKRSDGYLRLEAEDIEAVLVRRRSQREPCPDSDARSAMTPGAEAVFKQLIGQ